MYLKQSILLVAVLVTRRCDALFEDTGRYPTGWSIDHTEDCAKCLLERKYICEDGQKCQRGLFRENLYRTAFVNHCFGLNMLNPTVVGGMLNRIDADESGWDEYLQKLLLVINGSGLWTSTYFTTRTSCSPTKLNIKSRESREIGEKKRMVRDHPRPGRFRPARKGMTRYFSIHQFRCPINDSVVWREKYRYCDRRDKVEGATDCLCKDDTGFLINSNVCLDNFGYEKQGCMNEPKITFCDCSNITTTSADTSQRSTTGALVPRYQGLNYSTIWEPSTTSLAFGASTLESTSKTANLTGVVVVLCVLLFFLIGVVVCYVIKKRFFKDSNDQDWTTLQHGIEPSVQTTVPSPLPDAGYLSVRDEPESIYQTIEPSSQPKPSRLFSITSAGTIASSGSRAKLFRPTAMSLSSEILRRNAESEQVNAAALKMDEDYASITVKQDEHTYDLPPDCVDDKTVGSDTNLYATPCDAKLPEDELESDLRVNPLYSIN